MLKRITIFWGLVLWMVAVLGARAVWSETPPPDELFLRLNRIFGYASLAGKQIQGVFDMKASGPADLQRVQFYVDDELIAEDLEEPFAVRFSTDQYALGMHRLWAVGLTASGRELKSQEVELEFVTAEEGMRAGLRFVMPLMVIVFGSLALAYAGMLFSTSRMRDLPLGAQRKYGLAGGAICPRCRRPYSRHFWSMNLGAGKLERCPFCGKWAVVRAMPLEALRQAEKDELALAQAGAIGASESEEERLRKSLEDSRYREM